MEPPIAVITVVVTIVEYDSHMTDLILPLFFSSCYVNAMVVNVNVAVVSVSAALAKQIHYLL